MPGISRTEDQSQEERDLLKMVIQAWDTAEPTHRQHRDRWAPWWGLYRNYRKLVTSHSGASSEADRDESIRDAQREWGADLFVPYVYATVETILARILLNEPKMIGRPLSPSVPREATEAVRHLFERRQEEISYAMTLLPTAKRGIQFGLGVQMTYWDEDIRQRQVMSRGIFGGQKVTTEGVTVSRGPMADDVDIWDFRWDPAAKDMRAGSQRTCSYVIHRTWRNIRYIADQVALGQQTQGRKGWIELDLERVKGLGSTTDRGQMWSERMDAAGITNYDTNQGRLHEVWQYHDGEQVITVLDKQLVVQAKPTPFYHRELPFQIYRPTLQPGEFVGGGDIEPIAQLQAELNTLRSQRRDNATLVLQKPFLYQEGALDPADLIFGPAVGIPTLGPPKEVVQPLEFGEIPASGYREEQALKDDIERAVGISEAFAGSAGQTSATDTATGLQLVQAAADVRIKLRARSLVWEVVKAGAAQWLELYRQNIQGSMTIPVADPNQEGGQGFTKVSQDHLQQPMEILPVYGSTEPDNVPQKRNDALSVYNQLRGNPAADQRKLALYLMSEFDLPDPEGYLTPPGVDPAALQNVGMALQQAGIPGDKVLSAVRAVLASQTQNGAAAPVAAPSQGQEQQ